MDQSFTLNPTPLDISQFRRSIAADLILTVCLLGIWNVVVQNNHFKFLNYTLKTERYALWKWIIFSLLTFGIYSIYIEYRKARDMASIMKVDETADVIVAVVLSMFGMNFVFDALFQSKLNDWVVATQIGYAAKY